MARFEKGKSGNPGGRPKLPHDVRELSKGKSKAALEAIIAIMEDPEEPTACRLSAAKEILDRAWGKAPQAMTGENGEGPAEIIIRWLKPDEA